MSKNISLEQLGGLIAPDRYPGEDEPLDNARQLAKLKRILEQVVIHRLTERQREILVLYYYQKRKIPEIAEMLCINKSTVSRTLTRAVNNLKRYLEFYVIR